MPRRSDTVRISGGACFLGALILLTVPLRFLLAALAAAAVHELCHLCAIRLCGGSVTSISIGAGGTVMETTPLPPGRELLAALAGPAGSFLLLLFAQWLPLCALFGLVQGAFNLLPVYPLDGGRIMRCAALLSGFSWAERAADMLGYAAAAAVFFLGIWAAFALRLGFYAVITGAVLLYRALPRNNSCKTAPVWVQ